MSVVYYNEHDEYAAEWLRNLIAAGHIAPGIVDSRDIRDIAPDELKGFTQCHFFAGVGVWSYALRSSGIPDSQPLWTGSCPCQPFSAAGGRKGIADERHLWPHWHYLIEQCGPPIVLGEQVASKDGLGWLDLVSADLEGTGYAVGAVDLCAAGLGVEWENSQGGEWLRRAIHDCTDPRIAMALSDFADWAGAGNIGDGGKHIRQRLYFVGLADSDGGQPRQTGGLQSGGQFRQQPEDSRSADRSSGSDASDSRRDAVDWLFCRDDKWRSVESGTFPLAHGVTARVGKLRAFGNALDAKTATRFCEVVKEIVDA